MCILSRRGILLGCALLCLDLPATAAHWTRFLLDTNLSSARIDLDALGETDRDSSKVSGFVDIELDSFARPTQLSFGDFAMQTLEVLNYRLDFGFVGDGTARVPSLEIFRVEQPEVPTPVPLGATGGFVIPLLRYRTHGDGRYRVTGLPCSLLQAGGRLCEDTVDFDSGPTGSIPDLSGTLTVAGGLLRLEAAYAFSRPLDPQSPDFATVTGFVELTAQAVMLGIRRSDDGVVLRWVRTSPATTVWMSQTLAPNAVWTTVNLPVTTVGNFFEVSLPSLDQQRYFRLQ